MAIKYKKSTVSRRPTFRTQKFGNLLCPTLQGEVEQSSPGDWIGWVYIGEDGMEFKVGFMSRAAAARWTNKQLRNRGVNEGL